MSLVGRKRRSGVKEETGSWIGRKIIFGTILGGVEGYARGKK